MGSANQYRRCISGDAGALNPFRYRGYIYDEETGLYYLRSRYYNPKLSRFINADDVEALGADGDINGYQLFNYCMNDPVNRRDEAGSWSLPNWAKVAIGAALIVGAAVVATVATGGVACFAYGAAIGAARYRARLAEPFQAQSKAESRREAGTALLKRRLMVPRMVSLAAQSAALLWVVSPVRIALLLVHRFKRRTALYQLKKLYRDSWCGQKTLTRANAR